MRDRCRFALGLLAQDGEARLEVGRLDVGDEPPLEPRAQAVLERGDVVRAAIGAEHDLPAGLVERVERVEQLLLEPFLAFDELDVVDEQHVGRVAVLATERLLRAVPDAVDVVVEERLGRDVPDQEVRVVLPHEVGDGLEQVGLAQPGVAVDEQRVVGERRPLGDGQGGRVGEAVRRADHEGVEGVLGVQRVEAGGVVPGQRRRREVEPGLAQPQRVVEVQVRVDIGGVGSLCVPR